MTPLRRLTFALAAAAIVAGAIATWLLLPVADAGSRVFAVDGVAIRGTDPVAYFTEAAPVPGDPDITADWAGATWRFATRENRDAFLAAPESYAPQFGGYCAWAVAAKGALATTQPANWTIADGKLYLNYSDAVQADWLQDVPGFIAAGERRWPAIAAGLQ